MALPRSAPARAATLSSLDFEVAAKQRQASQQGLAADRLPILLCVGLCAAGLALISSYRGYTVPQAAAETTAQLPAHDADAVAVRRGEYVGGTSQLRAELAQARQEMAALRQQATALQQAQEQARFNEHAREKVGSEHKALDEEALHHYLRCRPSVLLLQEKELLKKHAKTLKAEEEALRQGKWSEVEKVLRKAKKLTKGEQKVLGEVHKLLAKSQKQADKIARSWVDPQVLKDLPEDFLHKQEKETHRRAKLAKQLSDLEAHLGKMQGERAALLQRQAEFDRQRIHEATRETRGA